jgi:hypothetical protein
MPVDASSWRFRPEEVFGYLTVNIFNHVDHCGSEHGGADVVRLGIPLTEIVDRRYHFQSAFDITVEAM